ncbi:glycosyl hydrolase family 28-related protein [Paenibacillus jilunlii]|uniref:Rhamnogalacturonase A/B/Epimerase-like pectate lyase domain-containing protein n=2 Tax=Paenibacillus jilunlii TaxID=682956 RepID=A0ABR5T0U4_9BACL|nr:glycosyl hydrolase family 28-related protein [Paenibacillus jilunlii]KWX79916.1 hypothetical protein AML91_01740 [Paenibacillus jilunlii]
MTLPWRGTTPEIASEADSRYETPGGAQNKVDTAYDALLHLLKLAVTGLSDGSEAAIARYSTPYGITYDWLKDRLDAADQREINMVILNVISEGAKGDGVIDDTVAFTTAIQKLKQMGGGILYIPPGKFVISQRLDITNTEIVIMGAGIQLTQLFFTSSGAIKFSTTNPFSDCIEIRELSLITLTNNIYKAIEIEFPSNPGSSWRNVFISNVMLCGSTTISAYNAANNGSQIGPQSWAAAITLNNCAVSVISDCIIRSGTNGVSANIGDGIILEGYTVDVMIRGVKIINASTAFRKDGPGEGLVLDSCMGINVKRAVLINDNETSLNGVYASVKNCHFSYFLSGIKARFHPQINIEGCLIYKLNSSSAESDIMLDYCDRSKVTSNTLIANLGGTSANGIVISNSNRCQATQNIIEERNTAIWLLNSTNSCDVADNTFDNNTTNVLNQGGNYVKKRKYEGTTVITFTGGETVVNIPIPFWSLTAKANSGFLNSSGGSQTIIGFYNYDDSTDDNAKFLIKRMDGLAITAEAVRFSFELCE